MADPQSTPLPLLAAFLADSDVPCPGCGYNLRTLARDTCPECGQQLVLQVGLREPKQAAFITGLVGLAAGTGFSGMLLAYAAITVARYGRRLPLGTMFALTGGGLLLEGAMLYLWLRRGRAIRRSRAGWRWTLAAACWALTFVNLLVFTLKIR